MTAHSPDYLKQNRVAWDAEAPSYVATGERAWTSEPSWGIWGVPEKELRLLPDVSGVDVLEAGCGTAYVSAWLARRGARPIGLDNSPQQLATARRLQGEHDLRFPLINGFAERLPFRDESFDFVVSEYGAAIWSDPYRWIPEAARVLRPNGELLFLGNSTLLMLCTRDGPETPAEPVLHRDFFGMHRFDWPEDDPPSVEFHLGHGDWIRLLRANDFEIIDLVELRSPADAETRYDFVTADWAHRWPSEEVWKARKRI
ncbi:MAG: class I SAM-dependent methyltransferase [bacterium]|nr:class I SAM-dependent methyltransferase [bacterium]